MYFKKNGKIEKPYLHWPGMDMVFMFCDPISDVLFTLLGQTWCLKWSLKDWTEKDALKTDEKYKKPYLHWPGIDMVFWRKKYCDPLSDLLFTLLGQTWWPKWSLKDWTKKDV